MVAAAACSTSSPTPSTVAEATPSPTTVPATIDGDVSETTVAPETTAVPDTTVGSETPGGATTTVPPRSLDDLVLEPAEAGTGFGASVLMVTPPGDDRRFVVEQRGSVQVIVDGAPPEVFFDISELVRFDGEQGLLGLAFHPKFADNDLLYLNYVNNDGDTVVASMLADGDIALQETLTEIIRIDQPARNHNGGMIQFGPDGNLWIGMGDGGGANDQFGNGQRDDTFLGSMLRVTVGPGIDGYEIPEGNLNDEVWAIGLRNPWRWTFDADELWIADVGQNQIEEVNIVDWRDGNPNFGWSIQEGTSCFGGSDCDRSGLVQPIYEYSHDEGCSITGGAVYRGQAMPEMSGHYFFSDYCAGWVRSVDGSGNVREWFPAGTFSGVIGFGTESAGEIYVLTDDGTITELRASG
jgi:hypothetical protein